MDLLPNYYNDGDTFPDASSSAMIASSIYRLSQLGDSRADQYLTEANRIRQQVYRGISSRTGWNSPVVDPLSCKQWLTTKFLEPHAEFEDTGHDEIHQSPEAIAFILIMEAACRDAGQC